MDILLLGGADHGTYFPSFPEDGGRYRSSVREDLTYDREDSTHAGPTVAFPEGFSRQEKIDAMKLWMNRTR